MSAGEIREETRVQPIRADLQQYFVDISTACPYGLPHKAVYHQAIFTGLDDTTLGNFFANGFRRNGNCIYCMHCPDCRECVPIRILPQEFLPNRNQRRVWKKNQDLTAGVAPLTMNKENLTLLDKFLSARFPDSKGSAMDYYSGFFITSVTRCLEIRYRAGDTLVGVAVVDFSRSWLNAVYFYFDPELSWRSPGTMNILHLINFCRNHKIETLYLGYWLESISAMQYKARFKPHQLLENGRWIRYGNNIGEIVFSK